MEYSLRYDKSGAITSVLCDGEEINKLGYKRAIHLENKDSLRDIVRKNKVLLLLNYPGGELAPLRIDFDNQWQDTFEHRVQFVDEEVGNDYVFFIEVYEKTSNDLMVIFYYH